MNNLHKMQIIIDKMKQGTIESQRVLSKMRSMRVPPRLYTVHFENGKLEKRYL